MYVKFLNHFQLRLKISQEMHDVFVDKILIVDLIITVTSISITKTKDVMLKSYIYIGIVIGKTSSSSFCLQL